MPIFVFWGLEEKCIVWIMVTHFPSTSGDLGSNVSRRLDW